MPSQVIQQDMTYKIKADDTEIHIIKISFTLLQHISIGFKPATTQSHMKRDVSDKKLPQLKSIQIKKST